MGNSARNQHSSRPSFRIPRDHFVPGKRFCSKTNPRKLQGFERHTLSWRRSRDAAPQRRRPARRRPARRGRVDAARCTPTITHMACAERVACVVRAAASTLEHALGARAVRRARAMRCARHGAPRRALPQHLLHVAVLGAAGRRRAERRCVGRCASPWTGIGITLLAPRRCKLLAVQVEINIADDHACCAPKDTVVLATLRDRGCVYRR